MTTARTDVYDRPVSALVSSLRAVLSLAGRENSRMVAATIGGHLDALAGEAPRRPALADATEAVRDASFGFLTSLHGRGDIHDARRQALTSVDHLEACLAA